MRLSIESDLKLSISRAYSRYHFRHEKIPNSRFSEFPREWNKLSSMIYMLAMRRRLLSRKLFYNPEQRAVCSERADHKYSAAVITNIKICFQLLRYFHAIHISPLLDISHANNSHEVK